VKFRPLLVLAGVLLVLALGVVAVRESLWRSDYRLAATAASPDGAWVAEVRELPANLALGSGVFLRRRWDLLRSVRPQLVFIGACDRVHPQWFGQRRLVIQCELRSGEPQLLRQFVGDVVIELVVDRSFG
jgi:hypothetical protein